MSGTYPSPTAAILCAEEVTERWCCPLCGGLNNATDTPARGSSRDGWCQHDRCVNDRAQRQRYGVFLGPEILFPAHALDRRPTVFA